VNNTYAFLLKNITTQESQYKIGWSYWKKRKKTTSEPNMDWVISVETRLFLIKTLMNICSYLVSGALGLGAGSYRPKYRWEVFTVWLLNWYVTSLPLSSSLLLSEQFLSVSRPIFESGTYRQAWALTTHNPLSHFTSHLAITYNT